MDLGIPDTSTAATFVTGPTQAAATDVVTEQDLADNTGLLQKLGLPADFDLKQAAIEAGIDFHSQKSGSNIQLSEESIQQRNYANLAYNRIENDYYQYQQGLMSEEVWQRKLLSIIGWYENCNVREIWERRKQFFVDDLVQQIEDSGVACQQKMSQLNVAE